MWRFSSVVAAALAWSAVLSPAFAVEGNAARGQRVFRACAACHSLQPDRNMTGPSLANVWNRKAGSLASFPRYSSALKSSEIVWNDKTLDEWIKDPQQLVPANEMTFPGVKDDQQRADLIAFLKSATQGGQAAQGSPRAGGMTGDRASVIFGAPEEISGFIHRGC